LSRSPDRESARFPRCLEAPPKPSSGGGATLRSFGLTISFGFFIGLLLDIFLCLLLGFVTIRFGRIVLKRPTKRLLLDRRAFDWLREGIWLGSASGRFLFWELLPHCGVVFGSPLCLLVIASFPDRIALVGSWLFVLDSLLAGRPFCGIFGVGSLHCVLIAPLCLVFLNLLSGDSIFRLGLKGDD
jgi:hypothetical protein